MKLSGFFLLIPNYLNLMQIQIAPMQYICVLRARNLLWLHCVCALIAHFCQPLKYLFRSHTLHSRINFFRRNWCFFADVGHRVEAN